MRKIRTLKSVDFARQILEMKGKISALSVSANNNLGDVVVSLVDADIHVMDMRMKEHIHLASMKNVSLRMRK